MPGCTNLGSLGLRDYVQVLAARSRSAGEQGTLQWYRSTASLGRSHTSATKRCYAAFGTGIHHTGPPGVSISFTGCSLNVLRPSRWGPHPSLPIQPAIAPAGDLLKCLVWLVRVHRQAAPCPSAPTCSWPLGLKQMQRRGCSKPPQSMSAIPDAQAHMKSSTI